VGDVVSVSGVGTGGWKIAQNAGQTILAAQFGATYLYTNWNGLISNWQQTSAPNEPWVSVASSADGRKLVAVWSSYDPVSYTWSSGIYTSTNSGATWTAQTNAPNEVWSVVASSADGTKLLLTDGAYIYTSTNSGASWTQRQSAPPGGGWSDVCSSADGTKLVAVAPGDTNYPNPLVGGIYTSTNAGATWKQTSAPTNYFWLHVACSADGSKVAATAEYSYVGPGGGIYISTNYGGTWTWAYDSDGYDVCSSVDGSTLVTAEYQSSCNYIFVSTNSGATWMPQLPGDLLLYWDTFACSGDGTKLAGCAYDHSLIGQIYISTDFWATAIQPSAPAPTGTYGTFAFSADGTKLVTAAGGRIYIAQAMIQQTTTPGPAGYLTGGQNSTIELQYIGNGQWQPLSYVGTINADTSSNSTAAETFTGAFIGDGSGLTNIVFPSAANYVLSYSTTTQAVATASTFQDITNNVDAQLSGWTHTAGTTSFTNAQTGLYLVEYTAEATVTSATTTTISLRAVVNGTEIAGSQSTAVANTANQIVPISKSFIVSLNSGDILKFQLTGSSTVDRIVSNSGTGTTRPSFSCTIIRLQ